VKKIKAKTVNPFSGSG